MSPEDVFPDLGYDPTFDVGIECPPPLTEAYNPPSAKVSAEYLPPVGDQGEIPSCCAWATTYGLATFTAAKRLNSPPTRKHLIASPAYIYRQVCLEEPGPTLSPCKGTSGHYYYKILAGQGTPSLHAAPYFDTCPELVQYYKGKQIPPDSRFVLRNAKGVSTKDALRMKQLLGSNCALAYATSLYTDWWPYRGSPVPYVGNGKIAKGVGHCMLIIGYDDGIGGFLLQNSQGKKWGANGYVWMAYETFGKLAQPAAVYYAED